MFLMDVRRWPVIHLWYYFRKISWVSQEIFRILYQKIAFQMILDILLIVLGIVMVLWGADRLTDGAVALAERMNVPQIVIGLTIVAFGTSAPELFVSLMSALKGTPDLAVGNVVGSNIFNTMLIVGVSAMVAPMVISKATVKKDLPFALFASVLLMSFCLDGDISRIDACLLLAALGLFMWYTFKMAKTETEKTDEERKPLSPLMASAWLLLGLFGLIVGSNIFVSHATSIASTLGISEAVVGLTIVAGGTSLPELATSVVAARKGKSAIAIGNVLGSNVMNILLILGLTGVISPMHIQGITILDYSVMGGSMLLLWFFSFTKYTVARWEGAVLTALFLGYMWYLI